MIDLYCRRNDLAGNEFESFRREFLQDISFRKLDEQEKVDKPADGRIFLVLVLPPKNRQNNVDILSDDIQKVAEKYSLGSKCLNSLSFYMYYVRLKFRFYFE